MIAAQPLGVAMITGHRVRLVRLMPCHSDFVYQTYQNPDFMRLYRLSQESQSTLAQITQRLTEEQTYLPQQLRRIEWAIELLAGNHISPIGLASLVDYQPAHRRAEFLLGIPSTAARKMGLGLEASLLVFDFAFNQVNLNKLTTFVYGYNETAQKNTVHLGFKPEGILRQHLWTGQTFIDIYQNSLLQSEFRQNINIQRWSNRLLGRDITMTTVNIETLPKDYLRQIQRAFRREKNT